MHIHWNMRLGDDTTSTRNITHKVTLLRGKEHSYNQRCLVSYSLGRMQLWIRILMYMVFYSIGSSTGCRCQIVVGYYNPVVQGACCRHIMQCPPLYTPLYKAHTSFLHTGIPADRLTRAYRDPLPNLLYRPHPPHREI